jgi:hypothetical protein
MNGVISPGVSAGSKNVGASEMCTAQLSDPSGLAAAGPIGASTSSETATASTAMRMRRMRSSLTLGSDRRAHRRTAAGTHHCVDPPLGWNETTDQPATRR